MSSEGPDYVFMASIATAPTGSLSGFQRDAVLIGKKDSSDDTRDDDWLIVAHPAFDESSVAIELEQLPMEEVPGRSGFYRDPAAGRHKRYAGYWLAGSARIEGTDFVVIVQGRDWVSVALIATVLGGGFVAIVFLLIYSRRTGKSGGGSRH